LHVHEAEHSLLQDKAQGTPEEKEAAAKHFAEINNGARSCALQALKA
jgi:hypothetical protein